VNQQDFRFPTDEELDALMPEQPPFDPEAVKARTRAAVAGETKRPSRPPIFRGLLIAALVCGLSISALAAANLATNGRLAAALGLSAPRSAAVSEKTSAAEKTVPAPAASAAADPPAAEKAVPAEPPEIDALLSDTLKLTPELKKALRPSVQKVELTAEDQNVTMTVLQTLGDARCLYLPVRFDFPDSVTTAEELEFERMELDCGAGISCSVLSRTAHSLTRLMSLVTDEPLLGKTVTLRCKNYGRPLPVEDCTYVDLPADQVTTVYVDAQGRAEAADSPLLPAPPPPPTALPSSGSPTASPP
jgi:hypothetical protein